MIDLFIQRYDRNLLVFLCILAIIGTVMLYSASWYESFSSSNGRTDMLFLQNHLKRLLVGVFFLFGFLTIDYRKLKEIALFPKKLMGFSETPSSINIAFTDPEKGSNNITQEKATAITGAT